METEEKEMSGIDLAKTPEPSDIEEEEDDGKGEKEEPQDKSDDEKKDQKKVSICTYLKFLLAMINSTLTSLTKYLNRFSHDYRYIRKVLMKEKTNLKVYIIIQFYIYIKISIKISMLYVNFDDYYV